MSGRPALEHELCVLTSKISGARRAENKHHLNTPQTHLNELASQTVSPSASAHHKDGSRVAVDNKSTPTSQQHTFKRERLEFRNTLSHMVCHCLVREVTLVTFACDMTCDAPSRNEDEIARAGPQIRTALHRAEKRTILNQIVKVQTGKH